LGQNLLEERQRFPQQYFERQRYCRRHLAGRKWRQFAKPLLLPARHQLRRNGWRVHCDLGQLVPPLRNALPSHSSPPSLLKHLIQQKPSPSLGPVPDPASVTSATLFSKDMFIFNYFFTLCIPTPCRASPDY